MTDIFLVVLETTLSTSVIIVILLLLTPLLNRRYAAKWNYWIWIFLALRLLIPFSFNDVIHYTIVNREAKYEEDNSVQMTTSVMAQSGIEQIKNSSEQTGPRQRIILEIPEQMVIPIVSSGNKSGTSMTLLDVLVTVWLGGCVFFIAVHIISYLHYKKLITTQGRNIDEDYIVGLLVRLTEELHINQQIQMMLFRGAASPMVIGIFKPLVVLPEIQYSEQELYFILKHELVHLKRRDVLLKLLFVAANAVHWFNPIVWSMQKEAVVDMELSCDERVVQGMDFADRKAYTETLFAALHRKHMKRMILSTQFYGGKQVMKQRFRNILSRTPKKNGVLVLLFAVLLSSVFGAIIGCSAAAKTPGKDVIENVLSDFAKANEEQRATGIRTKINMEQKATDAQTDVAGNDALVPELVRQKAEQLVKNTFLYEKQLSVHYIDWRVESVTHSYTYQNFEGMVLEIYQFNFQLLTKKPEEIQLLEGMQIGADGWVVTGCPHSNYLVYQRTGDALIYLRHIFETEYVPGDKEFTEELQYLHNMGEFLPDTSLQEADAMLMTFVKEGFPIQDSVVCQNGEGYSIYLSEGKWAQTNKDEWTARRNGQVKLWITHFEDKSLDAVEKELASDGYAIIKDRRIRQDGDMIYAVKLKEFDGDVWGTFCTYPVDSQEGWGVEIQKMADTLLRKF